MRVISKKCCVVVVHHVVHLLHAFIYTQQFQTTQTTRGREEKIHHTHTHLIRSFFFQFRRFGGIISFDWSEENHWKERERESRDLAKLLKYCKERNMSDDDKKNSILHRLEIERRQRRKRVLEETKNVKYVVSRARFRVPQKKKTILKFKFITQSTITTIPTAAAAALKSVTQTQQH